MSSRWIANISVKLQPTLTEKSKIGEACQPLIEKLKQQYIKSDPNKNFNYLIDVYTKWYRNYLYFCEKLKSEDINRVKDEFESKFIRLEYTGSNDFSFAYCRHNDQWFIVGEHLTLDICLKNIEANSNFHPLG